MSFNLFCSQTYGGGNKLSEKPRLRSLYLWPDHESVHGSLDVLRRGALLGCCAGRVRIRRLGVPWRL